MNHRQWKKNFKKQYGRNPYLYEDRKRMAKYRARKFNSLWEQIGLATNEVMVAISKTVKEYTPKLVKAAAETTERMRLAMDELYKPQPVEFQPAEISGGIEIKEKRG